jgi:hypothetical protein
MNKLSKIFRRVLNAKYIHLDKETASYWFSKKKETLTIYFEKSNGATDWRNNFDFPAKPYRDMGNKWYAHRGFLKVWKVIEPHLVSAIKDPEIKTINIAGYSHGAAIALLCHEYCKFNRPDCKVTGVGFGCPRVIWGFIRTPVKKRFEGFTVVRNKRDIVTHVPPAIFGYRHPEGMLKIDDGVPCNGIDAHRAEGYIKSLIYYEEETAYEDNKNRPTERA